MACSIILVSGCLLILPGSFSLLPLHLPSRHLFPILPLCVSDPSSSHCPSSQLHPFLTSAPPHSPPHFSLQPSLLFPAMTVCRPSSLLSLTFQGCLSTYQHHNYLLIAQEIMSLQSFKKHPTAYEIKIKSSSLSMISIVPKVWSTLTFPPVLVFPSGVFHPHRTGYVLSYLWPSWNGFSLKGIQPVLKAQVKCKDSVIQADFNISFAWL